MTTKYYVAYYRSSLGYIDEESGVRPTEVEAESPDNVLTVVKSEDSFCRYVIYARTEGHRDLTDEEKAGVSEDEMGEEAYGGGYGYNDPKDEPRDL